MATKAAVEARCGLCGLWKEHHHEYETAAKGVIAPCVHCGSGPVFAGHLHVFEARQ